MLEQCLTSIARQTVAPARVIIWDNGSRTPVAERIGGRDRVEIFRSESNLGFAAGANAALKRSSANLVGLVNNDVVLAPEWIASLVAVIDDEPSMAAVQSVILRPDGLVDGAGVDLSDGTFRQRGHGEQLGTLSGGAWGVSATAAIYRTEALTGVARRGEAFDTRLFAYYEDVELCARLIAGGWSVNVITEALATHRGSSSASALGKEALRLRVRNRWMVHRMHPGLCRGRALLAEDVRHVARALVSGRFSEVWTRMGAVLDGVTTRL